MITSRIIGADGRQLKINGEGEIGAVIHQHPPIDEDVAALPFRQYFTDNGASSGSNDMIVSASLASPQDFYIAASPEYDIYIKYITCEIADGGTPTLNKFGALSSLTNGVKWLWAGRRTPVEELVQRSCRELAGGSNGVFPIF